jgi:hypothetical protein
MDFTKEYSDYAVIEKHIRAHRIERAVKVATWMSNALVAFWEEVKAPPRPSTVMLTDRRGRLLGL